jgi:hypothetical protein
MSQYEKLTYGPQTTDTHQYTGEAVIGLILVREKTAEAWAESVETDLHRQPYAKLLYGWTLTNDEYIICLLQRYRKLKY